MSKGSLPQRRPPLFPRPLVPDELLRGLEELGIVPEKLRFVSELWAGFGSLWRGTTAKGEPSVIKVVTPPELGASAENERSRLRKLESYHVEQNYYVHHADVAESHGARCYFAGRSGDASVLVLQDLDALDFRERFRFRERAEQKAALRLLASFHAQTLGREATGLWPLGTYYHLATRSDEYDRMPNGSLKTNARRFAHALASAKHQCWVHGDAKPENFCVRRRGSTIDVRAVDFQYVGGGVGIVDVAYFASSVLSPSSSRRVADTLLDDYFEAFREAISSTLGAAKSHQVEEEWRELYPLAWADLYRFLAGWAPGNYDDEPLALSYIEEALDLISR